MIEDNKSFQRRRLTFKRDVIILIIITTFRIHEEYDNFVEMLLLCKISFFGSPHQDFMLSKFIAQKWPWQKWHQKV